MLTVAEAEHKVATLYLLSYCHLTTENGSMVVPTNPQIGPQARNVVLGKADGLDIAWVKPILGSGEP